MRVDEPRHDGRARWENNYVKNPEAFPFQDVLYVGFKGSTNKVDYLSISATARRDLGHALYEIGSWGLRSCGLITAP